VSLVASWFGTAADVLAAHVRDVLVDAGAAQDDDGTGADRFVLSASTVHRLRRHGVIVVARRTIERNRRADARVRAISAELARFRSEVASHLHRARTPASHEPTRGDRLQALREANQRAISNAASVIRRSRELLSSAPGRQRSPARPPAPPP
jgi:hypothetical protein